MSEQAIAHFRDYPWWVNADRPIGTWAELGNGWRVLVHGGGNTYSAAIDNYTFGPFDAPEEALACAKAPRSAIHTERQVVTCEESDGLRESMVFRVETLRAVCDIDQPGHGDVDIWQLPDGTFLHDYRPFYEGTCAHWVAKEPSYG